MIEVAQPIDFDSDARSKMVSTLIGRVVGSTERLPYALMNKLPLPVPTSSTAPGVSFLAIETSIASAACFWCASSKIIAARVGIVSRLVTSRGILQFIARSLMPGGNRAKDPRSCDGLESQEMVRY